METSQTADLCCFEKIFREREGEREREEVKRVGFSDSCLSIETSQQLTRASRKEKRKERKKGAEKGFMEAQEEEGSRAKIGYNFGDFICFWGVIIGAFHSIM